MAAKNKGLGKGLNLLLGDVTADEGKKIPVKKTEIKEEKGVEKAEVMIKTRLIEPNRKQPRKEFNEELLQELADSIRVHGVIQPLILVKNGERYKIVAGERRWRAAKMVGLTEVPAIIKDYSEKDLAEIALIENIQRSDLNPIEEAEAYEALIRDYHLTQEELSERVSKSRSNITNALRLLKLPENVRTLLSSGTISVGHAKVLLGLDSAERQEEAAQQIVKENLSVRETEKWIHRKPKTEKPKKTLKNQVAYDAAELSLTEKFSTKVSIKRSKLNAGKIEINFYSLEDFERIVSHIK